MAGSVPGSNKIRIPQGGHNNTRGKNLTPVTAKTTDTDNTSAGHNSTQITHSNPNTTTGEGFGVNDTPVRSVGPWTKDDIKNALFGASPKSLGKPDLHHAQNMPGSAIHEVDPSLHRGNTALHPNKNNQGVTPQMRKEDRQLHWWYRAREQGADNLFPNYIYDNKK